MPLVLLAVGLGLIAWPLVSYVFPNVFPIQLARIYSSRSNAVLTPQLATFIEDTLLLDNITGLSLAIVATSRATPELHAWGNRTEDGDPMTPDTLFHIASISKAFCATALGLLIDDFARGGNVTALPPGLAELTWHTRLHDLLPAEQWGLMDTWASEHAHLRDVLSHVSGIPRHDVSYGPSDTPPDVMARLRYLRPAFELRERWSYNNIMYTVVAHVIETYAGRSYASFVEERVFVPLGMTASTFSPAKAEASGTFTQGWTEEGRRMSQRFSEETTTIMAGPGGVISNAVDMAKWISTWIGRGVYDNRTVIPPDVYRNVSYAHAVVTDYPMGPEHSMVGYGLGWFRNSYRGHDMVHHWGALPGVSTLAAFLPNDGVGVTLFANGEGKVESLVLILGRILDSALHVRAPPARTPTSPAYHNDTTTERHSRNAVLSVDAFAGAYANPGYGSFTLCSPSSTTSYCAQVRSEFSTVDGAHESDLLAAWPRVWSTHVRMRRREGNVFDMSLTTLYPHGYGRDVRPFETRGMATAAEFVEEDGRVVGFGMGGLGGRAQRCEGVRDRAEVWFDRVL